MKNKTIFNKVGTENFNISCPGIFSTLNREYHAVIIYLYGTTGQYKSIPFSKCLNHDFGHCTVLFGQRINPSPGFSYSDAHKHIKIQVYIHDQTSSQSHNHSVEYSIHLRPCSHRDRCGMPYASGSKCSFK